MIPGSATLNNSALLVVDVINFCAAEDYEDWERDIHYGRIRRMVPSLASFIAAYRQLGGTVMLVTSVPWQERYLPDNINELYRNDETARYWSKDTSGRGEQFYSIPTEGALIFTKPSYDAFTCPELVGALDERGIRYLIVAGLFGDGCVLATICGGFSRGYHFIIAQDLIETTDDEDRQTLQKHLKERVWPLMYGPTLESRAILAAFSVRAQ
jgi:nicotinamidase-related amidase